MNEQKINLKVQQNSLKRFLPLMEIETDIFDTITVDNLGQFSRELCKLDQITAP